MKAVVLSALTIACVLSFALGQYGYPGYYGTSGGSGFGGGGCKYFILSRGTAFSKRLHMRPAKTQINLSSAQADQSSLSAWTLWILGYPQGGGCEDSDQGARKL